MTGNPPDPDAMTCEDCLILQSFANEAEEINSQFSPAIGVVFPTGTIWDAFPLMSDSEVESAAKMYATPDDPITSWEVPAGDAGSSLMDRLSSGKTWDNSFNNLSNAFTDLWEDERGEINVTTTGVVLTVSAGVAALTYVNSQNINISVGPKPLPATVGLPTGYNFATGTIGGCGGMSSCFQPNH